MTLASALVATGMLAQEPADSGSSANETVARSANVPVAFAAYADVGTPDVDGWLSDAVWQTAEPVTDFFQSRPNDGEPATERTEVRVLYDIDALYIGARMFDSDPEAINAQLGRRDGSVQSDMFYVMIDSYHDHRTCFRFGANPAGVRYDVVTANDDTYGDTGWDPVWEVASRVDSLGWTAEFRIPFSQLRFSGDAEQTWGINFSRNIFRKDELSRWSWAPATEDGYASLFGHLAGIRDIPAPRRFEALPYTVAKTDFTEGANPANPFNDGSAQDVSAGIDLKYGVTSNLTLDATINPDFGQVEADPAVVNLSAFETYFSERRPFFVEGANIFSFGPGSAAPQLFYSRRIGKSPSRSVYEEDGFVDNPVATRIIAATKLSGQTAGWSVGLLDAATARTSAQISRGDGSRTSEPVEPFTNYAVLSLRKDLNEGSTGLGIVGTGVHRDLSDPVFDYLNSSAYAGGVDFFHKFSNNQFAVNGSVSGSHVRGDATAMIRAQRSSARYYQRPDQDYVSLDSSKTGMSGYAMSGSIGKVSGNWTYGTDVYAYSPGFEVNDAGFKTQVDRIFHGFYGGRRWMTPGKVFRQFQANASWAQSWNFGGTRQWSSAYFGVYGQLLNYWTLSLGGEYMLAGQSDKMTRGGPLMENPRTWFANFSIGTDSRKPLSFNAHTSRGQSEYGGVDGCVGAGLNFRPTGAVSLSFFPHYSYSKSAGFYVTKSVDATAVSTFGTRYVFSELDQKTVNATLRVDVALSPDLSIQLYAQPFLAAGDYDGFKEFAAPGTFDFSRYGQDGASTLDYDAEANSYTVDADGDGPAEPITFSNPDFRYRSLRSNLVLRWEYRPGSTLFLVWNHGQSGYASDPTFSVFDELGSLFGDDQQNTFLVKVNFWFSR